MPEIRKNLITGESVILTPERARRPHDFGSRAPPAPRPAYRAECPFCPGNEGTTPETSYAFPDPRDWRIRAFPNKFSVLDRRGDPWRRTEGLHVSSAAVGPHEVICEARRHDLALARMSEAEVGDVVRAYHHRFTAFYADPRVAYVSLFKNHGASAGTSLEHAHAQIVGVPMVPAQVRRRAAEAERYLEYSGACLFCRTLEDELAGGQRLVHQTPRFVSFVPWAALSPFHLWIFPRRHCGSFAAATGEELSDLGAHLRTLLRKVEVGLNDADFNLVVQSAGPDRASRPHLHWYVSVVARVTSLAGFEMGTAMYVNPSPPESSAAFLREIA